MKWINFLQKGINIFFSYIHTYIHTLIISHTHTHIQIINNTSTHHKLNYSHLSSLLSRINIHTHTHIHFPSSPLSSPTHKTKQYSETLFNVNYLDMTLKTSHYIILLLVAQIYSWNTLLDSTWKENDNYRVKNRHLLGEYIDCEVVGLIYLLHHWFLGSFSRSLEKVIVLWLRLDWLWWICRFVYVRLD